MHRPFITTVIEKFRGRSVASLLDRWRRGAWERRLEKAAEDARRLAEDYKRGEGRARR
jgi:hypothetical protein